MTEDRQTTNLDFLTKVLDEMPIIALLVDRAGHILYWSNELENLIGYTADDIATESDWWPIAYPDEQYREEAILAWHKEIERAVRGDRKIESQEWLIACKDGSRKCIEFSMALIGEYFLVVFKDMTERKRAEQELREKIEDLDRVFNLSLDLLCIADTDGYFRRVNPAWEELLGYSKEELEGRRFLDFVHPDDLEATLESLIELATGQYVVDFVNRYRGSDGSYRWIEWRSRPFRGRMIFAAARDVTERKLTEEALRFTQYVMDNMLDQAMWISPDARFIYVNKATTEFLGYTKEEMLGMTVGDVNPYFPIETWAAHWQEVREQKGMAFESIQRSKDGQLHPVEITAKIVEFEGMEYNCAFIRDITERKRTEQAIKQHEEESIRRKQEADAAAKQFLRDTIYAVTDGRLSLISYKEADQLCLENCYLAEVNDAETLGAARARVADTALDLEMHEDRVNALVSAVGEAAVNAIKHAGGGIVSINDLGDRMRVGIRDRGEGIESLILPTATLMTRFSTKRSMGFGYAIMLSSVDAVYLATGQQGTSIILEQRIKPVSSEISLVQLPDVW